MCFLPLASNMSASRTGNHKQVRVREVEDQENTDRSTSESRVWFVVPGCVSFVHTLTRDEACGC